MGTGFGHRTSRDAAGAVDMPSATTATETATATAKAPAPQAATTAAATPPPPPQRQLHQRQRTTRKRMKALIKDEYNNAPRYTQGGSRASHSTDQEQQQQQHKHTRRTHHSMSTHGDGHVCVHREHAAHTNTPPPPPEILASSSPTYALRCGHGQAPSQRVRWQGGQQRVGRDHQHQQSELASAERLGMGAWMEECTRTAGPWRAGITNRQASVEQNTA